MTARTVTVVSYEYHAKSGSTNRRRWVRDAEHYESREDAEHSAAVMRSSPDRHRNVHVQTFTLYTAGIHAAGIAKRKARLAEQASEQALAVRCGYCGSGPGFDCLDSGGEACEPHHTRLNAASKLVEA